MVICGLMMMSCKKEEPAKTAEPSHTVESKAATPERLTFESFAIPDTVVGCSCYFATDEESFNKQQYIYVNDYGNMAYVKINGQMLNFKMEEGDLDPSELNQTLENDQYKLELKGKRENGAEQLITFHGTMVLTDKKTGKTVQSSIFGECGC